MGRPKKSEVEKRLNKTGIVVADFKLGYKAFIPKEDKNESYANKTIDPSEWSISQLRAMADYMEENPNMTIFSDGSGKPVKK